MSRSTGKPIRPSWSGCEPTWYACSATSVPPSSTGARCWSGRTRSPRSSPRSRRRSSPVELAETRDLLEWLQDDHFTFLGYREYDAAEDDGELVLRTVEGSGLGILRPAGEAPVSASFARLPPEVRRFARQKNLLNLTKANSRATVHRPTYLDYVGVKRFDANGEVCGERRFIGLYTHTAYAASPWEIPVVRRKVERVVERAGLPPGGHDHKALVDIIETYPRDELFQISEDELFSTALGILHLGERRRVRLFVRHDPFGRFLSCLVFMPRDRFNTANRARVQEILEQAFGGETVDYGTRVTESVLARLHYVIRVAPGRSPEYDVAEVESRLAARTRDWTDELREAMFVELGEERAGELWERYADAFPGAYREDFPARQAVLDINRIEKLDPAGDLGMSLYLPYASPGDQLAFKLLRSGQPILLSHVLPLLENMGVEVTNERPYEIHRSHRPPVWIYDFGLRHSEGAELAGRPGARGASRTPSPGPGAARSRMTASTGSSSPPRITAREITVLRAIAKYLRQVGTTFSQAYMEATLAAHPRHRLSPRRAVQAAASTPGALRGHRREGAGARERDRGGCDRRRRKPRRGPHPAQLPAHDPR